MQSEWITVKEAAAMLDYSAGHFRRTFCDPKNPLVRIRAPKRAKRYGHIKVYRKDVESLMNTDILGPKK
jgi:hypothetical protein